MKTLNFKKALFITVFLTWFLSPVGVTFLKPPHDLAHAGSAFLFSPFDRLLWISLTFIIICYYEKELPISVSEMFSLKKINLKVVSVVAVFVVAACLICPSVYEIIFNDCVNFLLFFFVALTNEFVYRGWAMNAFFKVNSLKKANILQAGFFGLAYSLAYLVIAPKFSYEKSFIINNLPKVLLPWFTVPFIYFFLVGCVCGYVFYKIRSLWGPTAVSYLGGKIFWSLILLPLC